MGRATERPRRGAGDVRQKFSESIVEDAALAWLGALGYAVLHGPDIAMGEPAAERRVEGQAAGADGRLPD